MSTFSVDADRRRSAEIRVRRQSASEMEVRVTNAQREALVKTAQIARLARRAIRQLGIRRRGRLSIICISGRRIRALNKRFLRHDRVTDVLSFRYEGEQIIGEILIAPGQARAYARAHGIAYEEELARYVIHGLLHWLGHEDRTAAEQRRMCAMEDRLLAKCRQRVTRSGGPQPPGPNDAR